jgi:hypothetical protein
MLIDHIYIFVAELLLSSETSDASFKRHVKTYARCRFIVNITAHGLNEPQQW